MKYPCCILYALSLLALGGARAFVIHVPQDYPAIQLGINAAADGDTVLVASGEYHEHLNFLGRNIALIGEEGAAQTVLDGDSASVVITLSGGEDSTAVIQGFTIRNGLAHDQDQAGGITVNGAAPTIRENVITGNHHFEHFNHTTAGVYVDGCARLFDNEISGNSAAGVEIHHDSGAFPGWVARITGNLISGNLGTGLISYGPADILYNTIENNVSEFANGGGASLNFGNPLNFEHNTVAHNRLGQPDHPVNYGAGLWLNYPAHVNDNLFLENTGAFCGGGIMVATPDLLNFSRNQFIRNEAYLYGGGLAGNYELEEIRCYDNYFLENSALEGGAIGIPNAMMFVQRNFFVRNSSDSNTYCGVLTMYEGWSIILNSVFFENNARSALLYSEYGYSIANVFLGNLTTYLILYDEFSAGCNILYDNACGDSFPIGVWNMGYNRVNDPLFCDPDSLDFRLQEDSPCWTENCGVVGVLDLTCEGVGVEPPDLASARPSDFRLGAPYPNPFNPVAHVPYSLSAPAKIRLAVYDLLGRERIKLAEGFRAAGEHVAVLLGADLSAGVYLIKLSAGEQQSIRKCLLLK